MHTLVTCKNEDVQSKMKALKWPQHIIHYNFIGIFSRHQRAANSAVIGRIWPNFEHIRDSVIVLVTCKMKTLQWPRNIINRFFRCSRAAYSVASGWIWSEFEFIQAFMHVVVTYKNEQDPIKSESARMATPFLP